MENKQARRGLLSVPDVAQLLALKQHTIRDWVLKRKIPYVKIGVNVRFRPEVIEKLITDGEIPSRS
jgi:excisionase family DNA binding protein